MPVPSGTQRVTTPMDSVARIEIMTDAHLLQDDWTATVHFETGQYDEKNQLVGKTEFGTMRVTRRFGDVKDDPEVLQAMQLLKKKAYQWREEDIKAAEELAERAAERVAAEQAAAAE